MVWWVEGFDDDVCDGALLLCLVDDEKWSTESLGKSRRLLLTQFLAFSFKKVSYEYVIIACSVVMYCGFESTKHLSRMYSRLQNILSSYDRNTPLTSHPISQDSRSPLHLRPMIMFLVL